MTTSIDMEHPKQDAVDIFHSGFTCSESVIYAIKKILNWICLMTLLP